jgi:hypothetical protein
VDRVIHLGEESVKIETKFVVVNTAGRLSAVGLQ